MVLYNNFLFVPNLRNGWYERTVDLHKILSESESVYQRAQLSGKNTFSTINSTEHINVVDS